MAFGPPGSEHFYASILPSAIGLVETWFPDFGDCLFHAIGTLLGRGFTSAIVLNADSPTLPAAVLVEAASLLALPGDRAVLGPSTDGGYYLLGLKTGHRRLFEGIDWSTERVTEQTLARAAEIGLGTHLLPTWYDVDEAGALRVLYRDLFETPLPRDAPVPGPAPHTSKLMRKLIGSNDLVARLGLLPRSAAARDVARTSEFPAPLASAAACSGSSP
jgi:hypothetical protein